MSKLKVSAIHDPDNDNEALTIDTSGNVSFSGTVTGAMPDAIDVNASAPADSLAIDASGNVGVGTTSPINYTGQTALTLEGTDVSRIDMFATSTAMMAMVASYTDNACWIQTKSNVPLNFSVNSTDQMSLNTSGYLRFNSGYGSVAHAYGVRAWGAFSGTDGSIAGSGNVSSVTDNGTGDFTVSFSTSITDTNYSVVFGAKEKNNETGIRSDRHATLDRSPMSTSNFRCHSMNMSGTLIDIYRICFSVLR